MGEPGERRAHSAMIWSVRPSERLRHAIDPAIYTDDAA
jgi:hypothetical protein